MLNEICWDKTMSNVALDLAESECRSALGERSPPAISDSLAWALWRLGKFAEAIAEFDRALALAPRQAASLLGRALARHALGQDDLARADYDAARAIAPDIETSFENYGIHLTLP